MEYLDPSPDVQKKKYAFKCHRLKEEGVEKIFPVSLVLTLDVPNEEDVR